MMMMTMDVEVIIHSAIFELYRDRLNVFGIVQSTGDRTYGGENDGKEWWCWGYRGRFGGGGGGS